MKNKLLAQICKAVVISDILSTPVFTWRFLVEPVNDHLSIFIGLIRNINSVIVFLCFLEIIVFRFFMLFGWKHFNSTNEEFMFRYLNLFNISFSFATQFSRWMLGIYYKQQNAKKKIKIHGQKNKTKFHFFIQDHLRINIQKC